MKRAGLILGMVLMMVVFFRVDVVSGCEGVVIGPRINSVLYLKAIADAYGINITPDLGTQEFGAPIESLAGISRFSSKVFADIVDAVERKFRGRIYNFDRIIAEVNYLLDEYKDEIEKEVKEKQNKDITLNVNEIRSKLEDELEASKAYYYMNQFLDALGVKPDDKVGEYTTMGVYPVLQDPEWSGAGDLNRGMMVYEEKTIKGNTVKGVITDWMIAMELSGFTIGDLKRMISKRKKGFAVYVEESKNGKKKIKFKNEEGKEVEWSVMDAVKYYLGGSFDPTNAEHLRAFMNLCSELYLGERYKPHLLVMHGWGSLVDNAEAYYMKEFFTTGSRINEDGERETVLLKGEEPIGDEYYSYWGHRVYMMRKVLNLLNKTHYYGRDLSLSDSFDAGLVSAFVDRYYAMIRDLCYNPIAQSWNVQDDTERENIRNDAFNRLTKYIVLGPKLIPVLENAYDIHVDLTGRSYEAEFSRRKLSEWSEIAYMLEVYGGMSAEDAVTAVQGIIPVAGKEKENVGTNRGKIIDLIKKYYANFGYGRERTGFLDEDPETQWEETTKQLYKGMVFTVCNVLKWKDMFKITEKGMDGAIKALSEMFDISKKAGLPEMLMKDYLGLKGERLSRSEHLEDGRYAGKLMFWQQVLYAYYKKTGDLERAKEYVSYQLKARELIRQALGADVLGSYRGLTAFEAFENKLEADLSNLQEVLGKIKKVEDKIEWSDVPNIAGSIGTPETRLWPVLPSEGAEFQFPEISAGVKSYIDSQFGYQPEKDTGFATVPPQGQVGTLDVPPVL